MLFEISSSYSSADLFRQLFGKGKDDKDVNFDEITPELFELTVSGITRGRPVTVDEFKAMSEEDKLKLKDDSKPRDYLNLFNRNDDERKKKNRFGPFTRDWKTGRVNDDDLASALIKAIAVPAASFKARGVPHVMRVIEILVRIFFNLSQGS